LRKYLFINIVNLGYKSQDITLSLG
jgi:hypothetical protein